MQPDLRIDVSISDAATADLRTVADVANRWGSALPDELVHGLVDFVDSPRPVFRTRRVNRKGGTAGASQRLRLESSQRLCRLAAAFRAANGDLRIKHGSAS